MRDRKFRVTEIIEGRSGLVTEQETLKDSTDDESEITEIQLNRFVAHWCGHYKPYGFSCQCGNRFCQVCLDAGRARFCEECGTTIGPCCYKKRHDGRVLCPACWEFDWSHPLVEAVESVLLLACLAAGFLFLERFIR